MDKLLPIDLPPGVYANGTEYETKGRWMQADLIRWYNGHMRPIGGWQRFTQTALPEPARSAFTWRRNDSTPFAAFGTASHLYWTDGSLVTDITPSGLTPGDIDAGGGNGYGAGVYGSSTYGTPRSGAGVYDATVWDLDNFGQVLLALSSADGRLYQWDASTEPANATLVVKSGTSAVPTDCEGMFITDDRMVVMLGVGGDPREIQWCNQGDFTMWDATEATTAGDLQLKSNGRVLAGCKMIGTNLIFTDADVHTLTYVGYPYIYGTQRVGSNCGLIGKKAFAAQGNFAAWMGDLGFFMYNGIVQPLPCEVQKAVFDNLNRDQQSKIVCGVNSQYNEIWWFFPSLNSTENDSYVYWNYKENHWSVSFGVFSRTAWTDREVWPFPIGCGTDYNLYEQESGWTAAGASRNEMVTAVSGPLDVGSGDNIVNGNQMLYDTNTGGGTTALSILTKYTPNGAETTWGPYAIRADGSGYTDCRFNGRQMKLALTQTADGLWQFGNLRIAATMGGQR
jgi:hypothetical protein